MGVSTAERIESFKAGALAGIAFSLAYVIAILINNLVLVAKFEGLTQLQITMGINFGIKIAIALLSGFLFGVTYRYIIRTDQNSHLKDGAVLAFGLVRGLGLVEVFDNLAMLIILGVESLVCFVIARLILDLALHQNWVKPFD